MRTVVNHTTHYFGNPDRETLSGVEYFHALRQMDANFQAALRAADERGEFPKPKGEAA